MWRAIWKKELFSVLRSRWYWIACTLSPLLVLVWVVGPRFIERWTASTWTIGYVDGGSAESRALMDDVRRRFTTSTWIALPPDGRERDEGRLRNGELDAIFTLTPEAHITGRAHLLTRNLGNGDRIESLRNTISESLAETRLARRGLTKSEAEALLAPATLDVHRLGSLGKPGQTGDAVWIAYGLMAVIFLMVMVFGITILNAMCKEKSTKMVEVILSCTTADNLVIGKVAGVCSSAILQVFVWLLIGGSGLVLSAWWLGPLSSIPEDDSLSARIVAQLVALPGVFWVECALFLVLGLALFVLCFAAVGSLVENIEDGQHLQMPISLALDVPIVLSFVVKAVPDSPISAVAACIPPFAPFLMPMRLTLTDVPVWQVVLSLGLLIATLWAVRRLTAKVYRVGLLMTGKPPTLSEVWRWLRVA